MSTANIVKTKYLLIRPLVVAGRVRKSKIALVYKTWPCIVFCKKNVEACDKAVRYADNKDHRKNK